MFNPTDTVRRKLRRTWLAEVLLVAGILAFGGYALMSDSRLSPAQLLNSVTDIVNR